MNYKIVYEKMNGEEATIKFEARHDDTLSLMNRIIAVKDGRYIKSIEKIKK